MAGFWGFYARVVHRRHRWLLAGALVTTAVLALGLPRLEFKSTQDTMIPSGSPVYEENVVYQHQFGGDPMIILFTGDVRELFSPHNLVELEALEADIVATGGTHAVFSPLGAARFAVDQIAIGAQLTGQALPREQDAAAERAREEAAAAGATEADQEAAARAARDAVAQEFAERTGAEAVRLAAAGEQSLDNPAFVDFLVFDADGEIRPSFRGQFPDEQHVIMAVRLKGNLTIDEQGVVAGDIVELAEAADFEGFDVLPTGSPVLLKEINDRMRSDMATTGALAMGVMLVILLLVFRARWRWVSLPVALLGIAWAFGVLGLMGIALTMVTISGLPILIGLGVDFAIQAHSRYEEEAERGDDQAAILERSLTHVGPALFVTVVAGVAGFLALRISEVPMIRDFGTLLAVGVSVLLVNVLVVVPSVLAWRDHRRPHRVRPRGRQLLERGVHGLATVARGRPIVVVVLGVALVVAGYAAQDRTDVESDPERFVPQDSPVLTDLRRVRDVSGSSSDMGLMVEADDVLAPDVLEWMQRFEEVEVERHPGDVQRTSSIASITTEVTGFAPAREDVEAVLDIAPDWMLRTFVSEDHTRAHIIFAVGALSLGEQKQLIEDLKADIAGDVAPPEGVTVKSAGLSVVGIEAVDALTANRAVMAYAALAAVFVWLLVWFRNPVKAMLPLLPVATAVGASWAVIHLAGVQVNPLTAVSSPLVVATCTEFSVLVLARYLEERRRGGSPDEAVGTASQRIGRAFTASGLTTAGGFAVLAVSGFPLLSNFGIVVAINVLVALLCALVMLPPLLTWSDRLIVGRTVARREAASLEPGPVGAAAVVGVEPGD
ncbi:MAG: hydrophobe/amphiphile efflux-3 (HAE3) family transporter [Acidimicrobiia bacterium]|nr:hydrophobe/amphiphile efflux-3 (HAE3) family transporter [Acidimicrobiia bacterium]